VDSISATEHERNRVDYHDRTSHPSEEKQLCNENTSMLDNERLLSVTPSRVEQGIQEGSSERNAGF
jgi:hypothetical protein